MVVCFTHVVGVIRYLHESSKLDQVFCTETRPYNQGSRLTAYELVYEKINATLICDSMAAILMKQKNISAVVVGADRVVANGDTANKVGTYQLAIVAKHHNVPFYVACPVTTYDSSKQTGQEIVIEERPAKEMTTVKGVPVAAEGTLVWCQLAYYYSVEWPQSSVDYFVTMGWMDSREKNLSNLDCCSRCQHLNKKQESLHISNRITFCCCWDRSLRKTEQKSVQPRAWIPLHPSLPMSK